jgi:hypothetical protein
VLVAFLGPPRPTAIGRIAEHERIIAKVDAAGRPPLTHDYSMTSQCFDRGVIERNTPRRVRLRILLEEPFAVNHHNRPLHDECLGFDIDVDPPQSAGLTSPQAGGSHESTKDREVAVLRLGFCQ